MHILVLLLVCAVTVEIAAVCQPSPKDLESQFSKSCANLAALPPPLKCEDVWESFVEGFADRNPSDTASDYFNPYFTTLPIEVGASESLFWSRVEELVPMVSMMNENATIYSSKNIPASAIIDQLNTTANFCWCGYPDEPCTCENCIPVISFWEEFSTRFALASTGTIFWLSMSSAETYRNSSFFAMNEIPNLNASTVDGVVPLVVHGSNPGESCGEGSLVTLQNGLRDRGIEDFVCYDIYGDPLDPRQLVDCAVGIITAIQKGNVPTPSPCFGTAGGSGSRILIIVVPTAAATVTIAVVVVVVLVIIAILYRRRRANSDGLL